MATRFHLSAITPGNLPTVNSNWNTSAVNAVLMLHKDFDGNTLNSLSSDNTGAAAVRKLLIRQWITIPLATQTINGTVTGQIRYTMNSTTSRSGEGLVYVRVINPDNTIATEVGSMTTTALTTTLTNRTLIALTLSSVSITAGQRICFDFGWNYSTGSNTATNATISVRSVRSTSDLAVDNTSTAANNPWIEFSQTLLFRNESGILF